MTTTGKLEKWLSLLANFGVLAGILFLAIEIQQNQESLEDANRINAWSASDSALAYTSGFRELLITNADAALI